MCQNRKLCRLQLMLQHGDSRMLTVKAGTNLLEICRQQQIFIEAACSGRGICGKCRVQIVHGNESSANTAAESAAPVTKEERSIFTANELKKGYRLACQVNIMDDLAVRLPSRQDSMDIQTPEYYAGSRSSNLTKEAGRTAVAGQISAGRALAPEYSIAVDLGSTTLAAVLINSSGDILAQVSAVNSQRAYGGDVISRMQASNAGSRDELQRCICNDLQQMFFSLVQKLGGHGSVSRIAIAGNTTMLHLLRGYSCEKLGQAPFEPVSLQTECLPYREMFAEVAGCEDAVVYLLPGMSAFAGADITAGLYSSGFWQMPQDEAAFFVDLGTNGELACGSSKGFVTAAAAAGPAFEGGRLSCGIPGIPGAISNVSYLYHRVRIQTIGQKKPCGICGTGALEAVAALLGEGLLDADGLLAPELFEEGMVLAGREDGSRICLTQADIREIQMAKAAIRAGIEVLLSQYRQKLGNGALADISRVYLAGGFGYYLSAQTAAAIGLFPPEWKDKILLCGNTSLKGAAAFLTDPGCVRELEQICQKNISVQLEDDPQFQEIYIQQMGFEAAKKL